MIKIPYVDLSFKKKSKTHLVKIFKKILDEGVYVGGSEIKNFEKKIANWCKAKYAVSLNSGTDALTFALFSLGVRKGDEVITAPNSFIATVASIVHLGARPVFVDVLPDQNMNPDLIQNVITKKTKIIMPVHLTGRMCDMIKIKNIAKKNNLKIIEDAAQSVGAKINNITAGSAGDVGCFSAHPLKNLNAIGDSGYLTTNDKKIYELVKKISNHGIENRNIVKHFGHVSRMDNLQAAILNYRLKYLKKLINLRRRNAKFYFRYLKQEYIFLPKEKNNEFNTYHTFVIQVREKRDALMNYLIKNGIGCNIHYPIPIHLQPAAKFLNYKLGDFPFVEKQSKEILSLPINENLTEDNIIFISNLINSFFK